MSFTQENKLLFKRLFGLLKPYTKRIVIILICITASSGIGMLLPQFSKQIMDKGLLVKNLGVVIKFSLFTLVLVLTDQMIGLLETRYYSYVNSVFQHSLLKSAFKHILKLKMHYFSNTNFAEIMSNVGMDVGNVSRICDKGIFIIISQVLRIIGGVIGLLLIDWKLTLVVVCIAPVRYFTVKYLASKRKRVFEEYMEHNRKFSSWYGDCIGGVKEIKLWGTDRIKLGQFISKQRDIVKINIKLALLDEINKFSENITYQIIANALYILGAYIVFNSSLSIGGLFAFMTYSAYVTQPISAILNIGYNFSNIIPSAKRFFDFLDMESEVDNGREKQIRLSGNEIKGGIIFENVDFSYKKGEKVLNNINFEINAGEKIAIVGTNGSGKSTIINLLLRFYKPENGKILIDGMNINKVKLRDHRSLISVVSQDLYLFNTSIQENISNGVKIDNFKLLKAVKESGAHDFIEALPLKYKSEVGRNGSMLSGGERQKIAMARALVRDTSIMVLDEATANYDAESEAKVNEVLSRNASGKTVIVISHKPDILKRVDKIIVVDNGRIADFGRHEELYERSGIYRELTNIHRDFGKMVV